MDALHVERLRLRRIERTTVAGAFHEGDARLAGVARQIVEREHQRTLHQPVDQEAMLIGVDLGPNLSVTGSLATILWLVALRREGLNLSARRFLRLGLLVMPPALLAALAAATW